MFSLRSARGRAILAGAVLVLVLATVISVAIWRVGQYHEQLLAMEDTSATLRALRRARAEFLREQLVISTLGVSDDPALVDLYHEAAAELEYHLSQARAEVLAKGEAERVADLNDLAERIGQFTEGKALSIPILLEAASETAAQSATTAMPEMRAEAAAITADFNELIHEEQAEFAAQRAAADRAADTTLWLLIGLSAAAFVVATGTVAMVIVSVVHPLASLRASARAITSGDLEARARVSGPDEVASLARDFNQMTDTLSAKTEEYIATTNLTGDLIAKLDKHGRWVFLNDAACQFFGRPREELVGTDSRAFVHPEDIEPTAQAIRETRARKGLRTGFVNRQVTPMGTRVVEWNGYPLLDGEGQYAGIQITGRDITERKKAEEALRTQRDKFEGVIASLADGLDVVSRDYRVHFQNKVLHDRFGDLTGKLCYEGYMARETPCESCPMEKAIATGSTQTVEMTGADGREYEVTSTPFQDIDGETKVVEIARDVTERKRAEEQREELHAELKVRAITDSLTGLYNHAHFFQRLAEEIDRSNRYGRGFAVVMMDVDAFKHYNDSRGHQAGDQALRLVGDCIRAGLRRSDIAFRYGGDEFAAMLLHADSSRAQAVVKRINGRITARLKEMDDPAAAWLGLSAGVACFPDDTTTVGELIRIADAAMYDAKQLAWARGLTGQGQAVEPLASPPGLVHETQSRMLSTAASSVAAVLRDLGASELVPELDLRAIAAIAAAAEIKDPYIRDHQQRVSQGAAALAEKMGLPLEQVQDIRVAGLLHDLGKVSISEHILNKPGKLTQEEYAKIKEHSALGAMIVAHVEGLQRLVPIVRHHHERFDGKGYPDGLAGEDIPLEARILSVVDVFDAMTHERSYRKALSKAEAMAELERGAGTQFDPAAVKAFLALLKKRGDELACPVHAASEARQLATAKAAGRRKG